MKLILHMCLPTLKLAYGSRIVWAAFIFFLYNKQVGLQNLETYFWFGKNFSAKKKKYIYLPVEICVLCKCTYKH